MKRFFLFLLSALATTPCRAQLRYPQTKTLSASDTYFGKTYQDPLRWLEDVNDGEVKTWFKAQAELTDRLLAKIPGRDALVQEWLALDKLKSGEYSGTTYENGRLFYMKTAGGENVGKLYFRESWGGVEKLLFDPSSCELQFEAIRNLPGRTTIYSFVPSWDGKHVAIALTRGGAEYSEMRILDVVRHELLPECIYPSFGCYGWTPDSSSFFYDAKKHSDLTRSDIKLNSKTKLHELGTAISSDRDIFSNESNPELGIAPNERPWAYIVESNPDYILGRVHTAQNELRSFYAPVADLKHAKIKWNLLCQRSDNLTQGPVICKDSIYAVSHANAPRGKLVRTSASHPDWDHAEIIIPETDDVMGVIQRSKHYLVMVYFHGVVCRLIKYDLTSGAISEIKLPAAGTTPFRCLDWTTDRWLVFMTTWTTPVTTYDFDAQRGTFAKSILNTAVAYPSFKNLVSEEVEVPGHDGTMIPLSIIYRKGLSMDGKNCCILEGYGAYGSSIFPQFSLFKSVASRGVVLAYAHVRGGGEKGESWHKAGYKTTKPNTWKDFISCAEYLVQKGYTNPRKLAATGGSAGGILISRAIEERPDLFAAAVCDSPVVNAMRSEFTPNGPGNIPEFGTVKDPVECKALFEMDGVQHVQEHVKYPAVMGVGGWNDQRVPPWEAGKFVAAIQKASFSGKPVLLKINYDSGHGTQDKMVTFKNVAGELAFLLWQTGHRDFQPTD